MLASTSMIALWLLGLAPAGVADPPLGVAPIASVGDAASAASPAQLDDAVLQGLGRGELSLEGLDGDCPDRSCWIERAREHGMGQWLGPGPSSNARGIIDEARISTVERSDAWIRAQYLAASDLFVSDEGDQVDQGVCL